jgi:hypothetical protein
MRRRGTAIALGMWTIVCLGPVVACGHPSDGSRVADPGKSAAYDTPKGNFTQHYQHAFDAVIPADGLGAEVHADQPSPSSAARALTEVCNLGSIPSDGHHRTGSSQGWKTGETSIEQFAQGYDIRGADVVKEIRTRMSCSRYREQGEGGDAGGQVKVDRGVTVSDAPATDESLFFCEEGQRVRCVALMARDDVVSRVAVTATSRAESERVLGQVAPVAAKKILSAW